MQINTGRKEREGRERGGRGRGEGPVPGCRDKESARRNDIAICCNPANKILDADGELRMQTVLWMKDDVAHPLKLYSLPICVRFLT